MIVRAETVRWVLASSTAIAWMCLALLVVYVLLTAIFGNSLSIRRRSVPVAVRASDDAESSLGAQLR